MNLYREYKEKQMQEQYQKYDKEYFAKDTVTIYEQTRTQDFIIRIFKICVFAILLGLYQILSLNEDVKQISRKYMLTMETMGYLDAASRTSLMQDLSDLQVTDIDLTGSTMTDAGYGNAVYLQITCKLPIEQLNMDGNDMLRFFFEDGTIPIRVRRMSTAKN